MGLTVVTYCPDPDDAPDERFASPYLDDEVHQDRQGPGYSGSTCHSPIRQCTSLCVADALTSEEDNGVIVPMKRGQ